MQFGWVNMRAYNFFVCGPKFTIFFSPNVGGVIVDQLLFRFSTGLSVRDIRDQTRKLSEIAPNFALINFRGRAFPKNCAPLNTHASRHVAWKSFVTLLPIYLGGGPPKFWICIIQRTQIAIMWQSFTAIGRGSSEVARRK